MSRVANNRIEEGETFFGTLITPEIVSGAETTMRPTANALDGQTSGLFD